MTSTYRLDAARQERAASCLHLALGVARKFARTAPGLDLDEARDAAVAALIRAAALYDSSRAAKFSSYVHKAVVHRLIRLLEKQRKRLPARSLSMLPDGFAPADQRQHAPERQAELLDELGQYARLVSPGTWQLLVDYYGVGATLRELSARHGVSRQCLHNRIARAVALIRQRKGIAAANS